MAKTTKGLEKEYLELKKWYEGLNPDSPCDCAKYERYKILAEFLRFERRLTEYDKQS